MQPQPDDLMLFVQDGAVQPTFEQAEQALDLASAMVLGYTRGAGKSASGWRDGVGEVVLTVAARIIVNPHQVQWRNQAGNFSVMRSDGFKGFTLAEQFVLDRYRKKSI